MGCRHQPAMAGLNFEGPVFEVSMKPLSPQNRFACRGLEGITAESWYCPEVGYACTVQDPQTGELKEVKAGWSWTLFLRSGIFGQPLFLLKLHIWGFVFLVLCVVKPCGTVCC